MGIIHGTKIQSVIKSFWGTPPLIGKLKLEVHGYRLSQSFTYISTGSNAISRAVSHRFSGRQLNLRLVHVEFVAGRVSMRSEEFCRTWHKMPLFTFLLSGAGRMDHLLPMYQGTQPPPIQDISSTCLHRSSRSSLIDATM
jgi:hypothetical protein